MLQRRLKLGYARAARIVDEMEERGNCRPVYGLQATEYFNYQGAMATDAVRAAALEELTEEESADSILEQTPESYL